MVSPGHVGGTRGSGVVSSSADVLWMSVVRGMCLARASVSVDGVSG